MKKIGIMLSALIELGFLSTGCGLLKPCERYCMGYD